MKDRDSGWTALALVATPALGLAALLFDPTGFPFWRGGAYSDLLVSHGPISAFIRYSIISWHQIPLWNPLILSGMPLAADPLAGLWYLPNVLAWVLPGGLGFNLLFWAHLALASWGGLRLLRSEGASVPAAVLGGVVFAATPKLVGHIGLGHLTLVEAVCWTPWILVAVRQAIERANESSGRVGRYALAGALLGMIALIDPRWLIASGLLSLAYAGKCLAHSHDWRLRIGLGWKPGLVAAAIGLGLAAPALIPLAELLPRTTRSAMTSDAAVDVSLPPERILGTIMLQAGGWPETQTYLGATVWVLIACGAAISLRKGRFWTAVLLLGMLLALGAYTPVYGWVMRIIPGMSSMRAPARFLFVVALASAMLAGHAFDRLREAVDDARAARRVRLVGVAVGGLALALPLVVVVLRLGDPEVSGSELAWASVAGGLLSCMLVGMVGTGLGRSSAAGAMSAVILGLIALDLGWANVFTLEARPANSELSMDACDLVGRTVTFGEHRTFSPSYSLPQQAAMRCRLELADGVSPLQLTTYRDTMAAATGFPIGDYGVTLPPFPDGDVDSNWGPTIDAGLLGLLNVDRLVSAYPLQASGLTLLAHADGRWVYVNTLARPRAWIETANAEDAWRDVGALEWTPNRIRVQAVGPGTLVLSEIAYPGWQARVDGVRAPVVTNAGILRSVELPAGVHEVVLTFIPASVYMGLTLAVVALLLLAVLWGRR